MKLNEEKKEHSLLSFNWFMSGFSHICWISHWWQTKKTWNMFLLFLLYLYEFVKTVWYRCNLFANIETWASCLKMSTCEHLKFSIHFQHETENFNLKSTSASSCVFFITTTISHRSTHHKTQEWIHKCLMCKLSASSQSLISSHWWSSTYFPHGSHLFYKHHEIFTEMMP